MIHIHHTCEFDAQYISSGLFTAHEEWIHPKRKIDSYEIIYVICGIVYIQEEQSQYKLSTGDILLLHPNRVHFGYQTSPLKTAFYWVHFFVSDFTQLEIAQQHFLFSDHYKFAGYFKQLLHIANSPEYPAYSPDFVVMLLLNEICVGQKHVYNKFSKLLKDIAEWIRINSDKKLTAVMVAEHFGYHPDYICSLFRKSFGVSLKKYINDERIKYSKSLLLVSAYSIKQISDILGWENENQFIHYFKYHENMSPAKFRNMYYNTHFNKK